MSRADTPLDYDAFAADYARHRRVHPGVLERLVAGGEITETSRVLEVGCGTGNYLLALRDLIGCTVSGVDPSAEMLTRARARLAGAPFATGRAEQVPFAGQSFDLVFSVDVIHHVKGRSVFFREARRLLTPGGRLCTVTDSADDIVRRRPLSSHFPETAPVELERYPAMSVLRQEMAAAAFGEIDEERVELTYDLTDLQPYRDRAFSSLHLIPAAAFERGLARMTQELTRGPIQALSLYTLLWGISPLWHTQGIRHWRPVRNHGRSF